MTKVNNYFISFAAALTLGGCVTTGEPTVTQAERDFLHKGLNFRDQCMAVAKNQPIEFVDPAAECECVHRRQADTLPAWIVRRTVDAETGVNRTPFTQAEMARFEREVPATTIAAYKFCGFTY